MVRIKNIRLKEYDYKSNGYYFVTIVADQKRNILKEHEVFLKQELVRLTIIFSGLKIDYFVIMSNHLHAILILENCNTSIGSIIRRFKAKVSFELKQKIWQPNYYEHVIRTEKALERIREYIVNNPGAEILKFDQFYN